MNVSRISRPALVAMFFAMSCAQLFAGVPVGTACEQITSNQKRESDVVNIGRHGFRIVRLSVSRAGNVSTVTGRLCHVRKRVRDDKINFTAVINHGQSYSARVDSIEEGGLFPAGSGPTIVAERVAESVPGIPGKKIMSKVGKFYDRLGGDWRPAAAQLVDEIAQHYAQ